MYGETTLDFKIGDRVELHPGLDLWMMGARFGTVEKIGHVFVTVNLDAGTTTRFLPDRLRLVSDDIGPDRYPDVY